jgi:hypothetical protein
MSIQNKPSRTKTRKQEKQKKVTREQELLMRLKATDYKKQKWDVGAKHGCAYLQLLSWGWAGGSRVPG